ncbi:hypothetical protein ACFQDN_20910 [Pseudomonas asuensis]|uniref:hypothetical protein n=1 Tax=Pseudomonas asuensis TaxID=1825787 RepID=UPI001665D13B|nr:hypothetical protein [Pseudomonas asuensis]
MNPIHTGFGVTHHTVLPSSGEHSRPETLQVGTSVQPTIAALPASVQVGNLTFHIGRLMTRLSDTKAQLLHSALRSETPKEPLAHSPDKPDNDGVYTYVIGAQDYFASMHLPRQYPERMMLSCALDPSLGLKRVVISELKRDLTMGQVYCQAHFEPPHMATQTPASVLAAQDSSGQLTRALVIQGNPQDLEGAPLPSGVSVSTPSMLFSHDGSAGASTGMPGPSRSRPAHTARSEPYPASSQSGASSSRGRNARVPDPEHPGQTISRNALSQRQQVPDPEHPGQTISRAALTTRQSRARAAGRKANAENA